MAGYIGARSVSLSTTVATAQDVTATDTTPEVTIINNTHEDTDGGREGKVIFKGQQSGGEESTLAEIEANHSGSSDDEKANLIFRTNDGSDGTSPTERARFDSLGNFMVGHTSQDTPVDNGGAGVTLRKQGIMLIGGAGTSIYANREDSNGEIIQFRKDGTAIGSIGTGGGSELAISTPSGTQYISLKINGDTDGVQYSDSGTDHFGPWVSKDDAIDLGRSNGRWDDVYATNGTIQTSDENEKQNIASLTSAEITAATAISKLFKTFKWKSKVTAKGDDARTHTGVVAQQIQSAMSDAGLDAGNYAFFISSTWWEANEKYTDDNGKEQTRTNIFDTKDEAPEGATERTRMGIRYAELLAFIGAATEQRLTSIEARLDALEG